MLVFLGLVAAASRAHHTPGGSAGVHSPPSGVGDYLFTIFLLVVVVDDARSWSGSGSRSATCSPSTPDARSSATSSADLLRSSSRSSRCWPRRLHAPARPRHRRKQAGSEQIAAPRQDGEGAQGRAEAEGRGERPRVQVAAGRSSQRPRGLAVLGFIGVRIAAARAARPRRGAPPRARVRGARRGHARRPLRRDRSARRRSSPRTRASSGSSRRYGLPAIRPRRRSSTSSACCRSCARAAPRSDA